MDYRVPCVPDVLGVPEIFWNQAIIFELILEHGAWGWGGGVLPKRLQNAFGGLDA